MKYLIALVLTTGFLLASAPTAEASWYVNFGYESDYYRHTAPTYGYPNQGYNNYYQYPQQYPQQYGYQYPQYQTYGYNDYYQYQPQQAYQPYAPQYHTSAYNPYCYFTCR